VGCRYDHGARRSQLQGEAGKESSKQAAKHNSYCPCLIIRCRSRVSSRFMFSSPGACAVEEKNFRCMAPRRTRTGRLSDPLISICGFGKTQDPGSTTSGELAAPWMRVQVPKAKSQQRQSQVWAAGAGEEREPAGFAEATTTLTLTISYVTHRIQACYSLLFLQLSCDSASNMPCNLAAARQSRLGFCPVLTGPRQQS
jgi:hypothetical protein